MFERVPWYIHKDKNTKINLSNNICYDQIHALKVSELIRENGNGFSQYANEPKIYEDLSEFYGVPKTNIAIGMGLGELIPRIFNIFRDKTFSIVTPTWMMATGFCEVNCIKYYQGLDLRADVLYIANPNGQDGQVIDRDILESLCDAFEYVIIDEALRRLLRSHLFELSTWLLPETTFSYAKLLASLLLYLVFASVIVLVIIMLFGDFNNYVLRV